MRSLVTSKNVSWPRLIWPTLYIHLIFAAKYNVNYKSITNSGIEQ